MGYEDDLKIDMFSLHEEWIKQSNLFMEWAEQYADAIFVRDKEKELLDLTKAEIDSEIRLDPEAFHLNKKPKPTESSIAACVIQDERYKEQKKAYLEAVKEANIINGAKEAMNHRKAALENLTKLWIAGYYSDHMQGDDSIREAARKKAEDREKEQREKTQSRLTKQLKKLKRKKAE